MNAATLVPPKTRATLEDLYRVDYKAELIGGKLVKQMATGLKPSEVAANIYVSLRSYAKANKRGKAVTDNMGFAIEEISSGRESFSPDAAYHTGPFSDDPMEFIPAAPTFAVEVRSESDYGPAAEREMRLKREDYFEAGTLMVWDVDTEEGIVRSYTPATKSQPKVFCAGETADAEPAVPGWRIAVNEVFEVD